MSRYRVARISHFSRSLEPGVVFACEDSARAWVAQEQARVGGHLRLALVLEEDVTPVHTTEEWTLWSDGEVTDACGLDDGRGTPIESLSADAVELLDLAINSCSPMASAGVAALASIEQIVSSDRLAEGPSVTGMYQLVMIEHMRVVMRELGCSVEKDLYCLTDWHREGYECEFSFQLDPLLEKYTDRVNVLEHQEPL